MADHECEVCKTCSYHFVDCECKYFMTIWCIDDKNMENGLGKWFETLEAAESRFNEIKPQLHACLIEKNNTHCVFKWGRDD